MEERKFCSAPYTVCAQSPIDMDSSLFAAPVFPTRAAPASFLLNYY